MPPVPKPKARKKKPRHRLVRTSVLKRSPPPKAKGKSRFPNRRCPKLLAWIRHQVCAVTSRAPRGECGSHFIRGYVEPAHITTRGAGGYDRDNTIPLCPKHHDEQEGRTQEFEKKYDVNLRALAVGYTQQFDRQVALGWEAE